MAVVRDVSIILLVIVAMLLATMPMMLLGALAYGLGRLMRHRNLPAWLGLTTAYVRLAQAYVELGMAAVARPILAASEARASLRGWSTAAVRLLKGKRE
jgi:hypothetical protein